MMTVAQLIFRKSAYPEDVALAKALESEMGENWWLSFLGDSSYPRQIAGARSDEARDRERFDTGVAALRVAQRAIRAGVSAGLVAFPEKG